MQILELDARTTTTESDGLAPAKGIAVGVALGALMWIVIGLLVWELV